MAAKLDDTATVVNPPSQGYHQFASAKTGISIDILHAKAGVTATLKDAAPGEHEHYPLAYVLVCRRVAPARAAATAKKTTNAAGPDQHRRLAAPFPKTKNNVGVTNCECDTINATAGTVMVTGALVTTGSITTIAKSVDGVDVAKLKAEALTGVGDQTISGTLTVQKLVLGGWTLSLAADGSLQASGPPGAAFKTSAGIAAAAGVSATSVSASGDVTASGGVTAASASIGGELTADTVKASSSFSCKEEWTC